MATVVCRVCVNHQGWAHDDPTRRREPADVCKACHGTGVFQTAPYERLAEAAYDRQDQAWFDSQTDEVLVALWALCCDIETMPAYDDEVYDALAARGHFDD